LLFEGKQRFGHFGYLSNTARTVQASDYKERYRMVQILRRGQIAVFRVFDREGKPIGDVVQPKSTPVVGLGASTVLLVRGDGQTAYLPPKTLC
jgi:hypothetical protein